MHGPSPPQSLGTISPVPQVSVHDHHHHHVTLESDAIQMSKNVGPMLLLYALHCMRAFQMQIKATYSLTSLLTCVLIYLLS